jgi:hypothetical protein
MDLEFVMSFLSCPLAKVLKIIIREVQGFFNLGFHLRASLALSRVILESRRLMMK